MNVSLYQAAAAMNAHARWQELVAENLAVGSVPGARKQEASFAAVAAGYASGAPGLTQFVIPTAVVGANFSQGELTPSNTPTHFAINGPGFFEVRLPDGNLAYTRGGQFRLDPQGHLVTQHGYAVLGDRGPLQFDPNKPEAITLMPDGTLEQNGDSKGRLHIVEFDDPHRLSAIPGGCFVAGDPQVLGSDARASGVLQGLVEASNVSPLREMASLVTAMRMFEANQRVLQTQDERLGRVISELGNPS